MWRFPAVRAKMQMAVKDVVDRYTHAAWEEDCIGQFCLFGVDFLFDNHLGCWMLEWNQGQFPVALLLDIWQGLAPWAACTWRCVGCS